LIREILPDRDLDKDSLSLRRSGKMSCEDVRMREEDWLPIYRRTRTLHLRMGKREDKYLGSDLEMISLVFKNERR